MNKELTKKQKKEYLASGGNICPYCHSDDIEAGRPEADGGYCSHSVVCNACGKEWTDIYKLFDIEENDE